MWSIGTPKRPDRRPGRADAVPRARVAQARNFHERPVGVVPHGDVEVAREHERNLRRARVARERGDLLVPAPDVFRADRRHRVGEDELDVAARRLERRRDRGRRRLAGKPQHARVLERQAAVQREPDVMLVRHLVVVRVARAQALQLAQPSCAHFDESDDIGILPLDQAEEPLVVPVGVVDVRDEQPHVGSRRILRRGRRVEVPGHDAPEREGRECKAGEGGNEASLQREQRGTGEEGGGEVRGEIRQVVEQRERPRELGAQEGECKQDRENPRSRGARPAPAHGST